MFFFNPTLRNILSMFFDLTYHSITGRFPWEPKKKPNEIVFEQLQFRPADPEQAKARLTGKPVKR